MVCRLGSQMSAYAGWGLSVAASRAAARRLAASFFTVKATQSVACTAARVLRRGCLQGEQTGVSLPPHFQRCNQGQLELLQLAAGWQTGESRSCLPASASAVAQLSLGWRAGEQMAAAAYSQPAWSAAGQLCRCPDRADAWRQVL